MEPEENSNFLNGKLLSGKSNWKITSVEKRGSAGGKVIVIFSNGKRIILLRDTWLSEPLYEGDEIDPEKVASLQLRSDISEAKYKAFDLVSRAPHSIEGLKNKLRLRGHGETAIEKAVDRLIELEYLDDRRFAESWVQSRLDRYPSGKAKVFADLMQRGIHRELAQSVVSRIITSDKEEECLHSVLKKISRHSHNPKHKVYAKLSALGFNHEMVRRIMGDRED